MQFSFQMTSFLAILALSTNVACFRAPRALQPRAETVAVASFPQGMSQSVRANIVFSAKSNDPVLVHVDSTGLPQEGGPFYYHIHEHPVPADGNCDAVGDHFNPFNAPADCDSLPSNSYCEVGDLSGKHGFINTTCFETKYTDPYLSLNPKSQSYIGGRSVVFHFANNTRFACATIQNVSGREARKYLDTKAMVSDLEKRSEVEFNATSIDNSTSNGIVNKKLVEYMRQKPSSNISNGTFKTLDYSDALSKTTPLSLTGMLVVLSAISLL
ncbi:Cell surface superoxide dismutase Cu-Zn 6 [Meyerozyma sp. JA9]|nr:Cell surface superoxide dismutase Cu-Zn 6 [Meyerozyma sp. JA9]